VPDNPAQDNPRLNGKKKSAHQCDKGGGVDKGGCAITLPKKKVDGLEEQAQPQQALVKIKLQNLVLKI